MTSFRTAIYEETRQENPLHALEIAKKYIAIQKEELLTSIRLWNDEELDFDVVKEWLQDMIFSEDDIAELMVDFLLIASYDEYFEEIRDMQHDIFNFFDEELINSFKD